MSSYPPFAYEMMSAYLAGKTLKAMLVGSTYDQDIADEFVADISSHEIAPSGYSRKTLTGVSVELNSTTGEVYIKCNDINFGTFTQANVLGPVFYVDGASDAVRRLIGGSTDSDPTDISSAVAAIFRIDPDQGIYVDTPVQA